jgi:LSD1 subclass zinc finger protein
MQTEPTPSQTIQAEVTCPSCAAHLKYKPGTDSLKCEYCNADVDIEKSEEIIQEIDFERFLASNEGVTVQQEIITIRCEGCGAHVTLDPNIVSDRCPFCNSILVTKMAVKESQIAPGSVLPFGIDAKQAFGEFKKWISKLWFAPNELKRFAIQPETLKGIYVPFWTYDSKTYNIYSGQRGDNYYVNENYTTTENGRTVTKTRTVTKIRWTSVSGEFGRDFDDVLVLASKSLPQKYADKLQPWDLNKLVPFNEKYLSGYRTETYQVELKDGFAAAQQVMDNELRAETCQRIGGDHQRIHSLRSTYNNVTFKHILLPVWISAFRYRTKVYRFLVNGRTGEVQGERPYSAWKIAGLVILILIAIGIIAAVVASQNG